MAFWDQVKRGVGRAAAEAEKQAHITRLNLEVNGVKGNIRRKVEAMGETALNLCRQGEMTHPSFTGLLQEIAELEGRVAELERQMAEIRGSPSPPP